MKISDIIARQILEMLDQQEGIVEIKRNEMADYFGCVPSQINYVLTSRFTPEQGYIVESYRGGGGCIKIKRVSVNRNEAIMTIINSIGTELSEQAGKRILESLLAQGLISENECKICAVAISDNCYRRVPVMYKNAIRCDIFKNLLLNLI